MARPKVPKTKRHVGRGVSLPPGAEQAALRRAGTLDLSFSRYVLRLIEHDLQHNVLRPYGEEARAA